MNESSFDGFLTGFSSLAVSLLLNGTIFLSVDQAISPEGMLQARLKSPVLEQKKEIVQFEFVEVPPGAAFEKPKKTRKIAERDSEARDLASSSLKKDSSPKTEVRGSSDQLGQRQGSGVPSRSLRSQPENQGIQKMRTPHGHPSHHPVRPSRPVTTTQRASPWISGQGKIITQEISRTKSGGAKFSGQTSFEATGSGMGVYMKNLKDKIWSQWFPYVAFKFPRDFKTADAVVEFTLDKHGKVRSTQVVESKGSPLFAAFCAEAVRQSRDFGDLPKEILDLTGKDEITISFAFHYS